MSGKKLKIMRHKLLNTSRACFLVEVAERVYGVDPLDVTRARTNVNARAAISVVLISEEERYESVAAFFKKDHSSILYIVRKHPDLMKYDKEYRANYQKFLIEIGKPVNKIEYTINDIKGRIQKFNAQLLELNYTGEMILEFWEEVITEGRKKHSA